MGDGFRGVSAERDGRFKLAEKKLMAKMKFPPEFVHKVDMSKVHLEVLRPWVAKKVSSVASFVIQRTRDVQLAVSPNAHGQLVFLNRTKLYLIGKRQIQDMAFTCT